MVAIKNLTLQLIENPTTVTNGSSHIRRHIHSTLSRLCFADISLNAYINAGYTGEAHNGKMWLNSVYSVLL